MKLSKKLQRLSLNAAKLKKQIEGCWLEADDLSGDCEAEVSVALNAATVLVHVIEGAAVAVQDEEQNNE